MPEIKLTKDQFIPFINISSTAEAEWARIDKSTIFDLKFNPQSKSQDYICDAMPTEDVSHYTPELAQEIAVEQGCKIYDFLSQMIETGLPVGSECQFPFLMCFGGSEKRAWQTRATILLGSLNTVDGKLTFTIKIGGTITCGTYVITDGKPVFTATGAAG